MARVMTRRALQIIVVFIVGTTLVSAAGAFCWISPQAIQPVASHSHCHPARFPSSLPSYPGSSDQGSSHPGSSHPGSTEHRCCVSGHPSALARNIVCPQRDLSQLEAVDAAKSLVHPGVIDLVATKAPSAGPPGFVPLRI